MKAQLLIYSGKKATMIFDNGDCWQSDAPFALKDIEEFDQIISRAGEVDKEWLEERGFVPLLEDENVN